MTILKTESSNKAKSIGFDGQVVQKRSEDERRAAHKTSPEDETDLEESITKNTSRKETGKGEEENKKNADSDNVTSDNVKSTNIISNVIAAIKNTTNANSSANNGNANESSNHASANANNSNKNDDDGPPLVAILAIFCLGMIFIPSVSRLPNFKKLSIGSSVAISTVPLVLVLVLLTVQLMLKYWKTNRSDQRNIGPVVVTISGLCPNTSAIQEKYPSNTYSFMAFYGPIRDTKLFCFGLFISLFQFALLFLMAANVIVPKFRTTGEVDNPGGFNIGFEDREWWGGGIFPSNCSAIVRATQIVSLMAYVLFPSPILNDVTGSVQLFPRFGQQDPDGKLKRLRFACTLQFVQGLLSTLSVFVLVMTSTDVIEIILNFTATNFISELDDNAFHQAEKGKYGPIIEEAVHSIKGEDLPNPISTNAKHRRYKYGIAFISIVLYMATAGVMIAQDNVYVWVTPTVRVQFNDEGSSYSGCYHMDTWDSSTRRYDYVGDGNNNASATMGYCLDERRWLIFEGGGNPCEIFGTRSEIAHSSKTDTYDIQSSIESDWFSPFNTPANMHFIQIDNLKESCGAFPGDGKCDDFLNDFLNQYDGGDCCSMTCIGDKCGFTDDCIDPSMTPFTIRIDSDNITIPVGSVLKLDCKSDEQEEYYEFFAIHSAHATTVQADWTEPAMVKEGSSCRFYFTTTEINGDETPLDYSVYHGYGNLAGVMRNEYFNIFSTTADQQNQTLATFDIPPAMLSLQGELITSSAQYFFDFINYLDPDMDMTIANIVNITNIEAGGNALTGTIPTEFGMMTSLTEIYLPGNALTGTIPTEFGMMTSLTEIYLHNNYLTGTIPTEFGMMKSLTGLGLNDNYLTGTIPTELGLMTSLTRLYLFGNALTGTIPTEIGLMTSLTTLYLNRNDLTGTIPTEFGMMTRLTFLYLANNRLTGTIPTEIAFMKRLIELYLRANALTGTIPTEFGLMTSLTGLYLDYNNLRGSTPSEVLELIENGLSCWGCPY